MAIVKIDRETRRQTKENKLKVLASTSEALKRPLTDAEFTAQLREWGTEAVEEDVSKLISTALKEGVFVLSPIKVPDETGKKMLRQTGVRESVPNGIDTNALQAAKDKELTSSLASVVAVRLNTTLRRQESITLSVEKLAKMLEDSLDYVLANGGIAKTAMRMIEEADHG